MFELHPGLERLVPYLFFLLYLITSVQICRYSRWIDSGAPNPFLPRRIDAVASRKDIVRLIRSDARFYHARSA